VKRRGELRRGAYLAGLLLLACACLAGCSRPQPETRVRFAAMGTLVEVTIYGLPADAAQAAAREVETLFNDLQARWDPWADGPLGRLNAAAGTSRSVAIEPGLGDMLDRAAEISRETGGLFDPAIGGLIRLWGFHDGDNPPTAPPAEAEIERSLQAMRPFAGIWRDGGRELSLPAGVAIDLGGFAKGEAVDLAVELLRARGIADAIVNAGGDLRAIGRHGDRDWRIGIREPRGDGVLAAIEVAGDESVFTSGDYERFFIVGERRYHHILDPRDGQPARGTVSVTVLGTEAALADDAATALFVAGPGQWEETARRLGLRYVMLVADSGTIFMTPEMEQRVRLSKAGAQWVVVRSLEAS
jgi:thiamine biosynthesis lipoprotein